MEVFLGLSTLLLSGYSLIMRFMGNPALLQTILAFFLCCLIITDGMITGVDWFTYFNLPIWIALLVFDGGRWLGKWGLNA